MESKKIQGMWPRFLLMLFLVVSVCGSFLSCSSHGHLVLQRSPIAEYAADIRIREEADGIYVDYTEIASPVGWGSYNERTHVSLRFLPLGEGVYQRERFQHHDGIEVYHGDNLKYLRDPIPYPEGTGWIGDVTTKELELDNDVLWDFVRKQISTKE